MLLSKERRGTKVEDMGEGSVQVSPIESCSVTYILLFLWGFPGGSSGKKQTNKQTNNPLANAGNIRDEGSSPG